MLSTDIFQNPFVLAILWCELRTSHLLGRCATTSAMPAVPLFRMLLIYSWLTLWSQKPDCICLGHLLLLCIAISFFSVYVGGGYLLKMK
jgi:hypothetical protein